VGILEAHIPLYREIFAIPELLEDPVLLLGFQRIWGDDLPADFRYRDVVDLLAARGVGEVKTVDFFDERADLRYDLNQPVPEDQHERYASVLDIGTIEHVFDSRQCLESCLRMVRPGGHYFVVTPVHGYHRHGFHTFHPRFVSQALQLNGFEIRYLRFSSEEGEPLGRADEAENSLVWIVGRKTRPIDEFQVPQQEVWREMYSKSS
jgi:hypothetical protein